MLFSIFSKLLFQLYFYLQLLFYLNFYMAAYLNGLEISHVKMDSSFLFYFCPFNLDIIFLYVLYSINVTT